jgi:hypothetical protein
MAPAVPLLHEEPSTDRGRIEVFSPSSRPVRVDWDVAVQADRDTVYTLAAAGEIWKSQPVPAGARPAFAHFVNVTVRPGPNTFFFGSDTLAATVFGELRFLNHSAIVDAMAVTSDDGVALTRAQRPHAIVGSVPLDISADALPSVKLQIAEHSPLTFGAIAELAYGGRNYRCYSDVAGNAVDESLTSAITACLQENVLYRQVTLDDLAHTLLRAIDIDVVLSSNVDELSVRPGLESVEVTWDGAASRNLESDAPAPSDTVQSERSGNAFTYQLSMKPQTRKGKLVDHLVEVRTRDARTIGHVDAEDAGGLHLTDQDGSHEWRAFSSIERVGIVGAGAFDLRLRWRADSSYHRLQYLGVTVDGAPVESGSVIFEAQTPRGRRRFAAPLHLDLDGTGAYLARFAEGAFGAAAGSIDRVALDMRVRAQFRTANSVRIRIQLPDDTVPGRVGTSVIRSGRTARAVWVDPRLSVFAFGAPAHGAGLPIPEQIVLAADGLTIATRSPGGADRAILTTREAYDPQWQGVCLGRCSPFLAHFRVDGYRNGWLVSGTGTILLFQSIVAVQAALVVVAFGLLTFLGRRLSPREAR